MRIAEWGMEQALSKSAVYLPAFNRMKKPLTFIVLGLLFAIPGEILNQILSRQNPRAFGSTMISYTILLFV